MIRRAGRSLCPPGSSYYFERFHRFHIHVRYSYSRSHDDANLYDTNGSYIDHAMRHVGRGGVANRARDGLAMPAVIALLLAAATLLWCFAPESPAVERVRFGDSATGPSLPTRRLETLSDSDGGDIVLRAAQPVGLLDSSVLALGLGILAVCGVFVGRIRQPRARLAAHWSVFTASRGPPLLLRIVR